MNSDNHPQDEKWQALLARSTPTFAGEALPPFGFITSTLARLRAERKEQEIFERIGLRALFVSLVVLVVTAGITWLQFQNGLDLEPGVKSLIQVHEFQLV